MAYLEREADRRIYFEDYGSGDTAVVPAVAHQNDIAGFWRDNTATAQAGNGENGIFGVDINGTGLVITDVLNELGQSLGRFGGTGTSVVFRVDD